MCVWRSFSQICLNGRLHQPEEYTLCKRTGETTGMQAAESKAEKNYVKIYMEDRARAQKVVCASLLWHTQRTDTSIFL